MDTMEEIEENWDHILEPDDSGTRPPKVKDRVIVHIDVDCFYAQVEAIMNSELRSKMIGVQQKNLVITTNYKARQAGVPKSGFVVDLAKRFPDLVLVNGEDLQHYRRFSKNIFDTLRECTKCPVERLGMDENFIDVTRLVEERLAKEVENDLKLEGNVFQNKSIDPARHKALIIGSRIAFELRELLRSKIGITSSAGIARNKLLAKVVGSKNKPDNQTLLLDDQALDLLDGSLSIRTIPGIGSATTAVLKDMVKIETIEHLRKADMGTIAEFLDPETAYKIKDLCMGIDRSEVKMSGRVQTIGLEYRFKPLRNLAECQDKLALLLTNLCKLIYEDGRLPQTIKVTARDKIKEEQMGKKFYKESRQTKIRSSLFSDLKKASELPEKKFSEVLTECTKLLEKMLTKEPCIGLLGLAVGDLIEPHESIQNFLAKMPTTKRKSNQSPEAIQTKEENYNIPSEWDPAMFESLPEEVKHDLLRNRNSQILQVSQGSLSKKPKCNSILNYFNKKK